MSFALHLSFPIFKSDSLPPKLTRVPFLCNSSSNSNQSYPSKQESQDDSQSQHHQVLLVERYMNGTAKRYILDDEFQLTTFLEDESKSNGFSSKELPWLPDLVKDFVLPAGYPGSVSDDYLEYMLFQFPTNVTGWICHTLVTSSLLKAVGLDYSSATTAAASAAAIRWVSKDGIGAVGRFFIGGRFGNLFDDDPKQWRMYADFIGSAGSIFDLCTPLYPAYFLPLASLGNLTKAVARGLKDPSFRVIQSHFAVSGNLGDVAAKEEVWDVSAQLIGLGLGILVLSTPGLVNSYPVLASTWMTMRLLHLWLRYQSLSVLQFNTVNLKRARILVNMHVSSSTVLGCEECNKMENILSWEIFSVPRIVFGVSLSDMLDGDTSGLKVKKLLELYSKEKYILVLNQQPFKDFEVLVSFKDGATSLSMLRSVWQTYWLYKNQSRQENMFDQLQESLKELDHQFDMFLQQLRDVGWDIDSINLKVRKDVFIQDFSMY
ncbi:putative Root UVB sensitive family [Helianthus annuus]|uniref:Root UVB sensitive family n=2 Tax=Helianthus annuus TaxID=4232 RepID=A0A251TA57_HELAN|nr:protein root UVB sensitive 5 isoform X1 [Helianthus annuus]KAF5759513.1 putative Root UVB sensitive family [Helianthus annuus]